MPQIKLPPLRWFEPSAFRTRLLAVVALACVGSTRRALADSCSVLKAIRLPDTTILTAETVAPGAFRGLDGHEDESLRLKEGEIFSQLPAFCRVAIVIRPSAESEIHAEVWMPEKGWNQRFLGVGNSGWGGALNYNSMAGGLRQGFAVGSTDMGTGGFSTSDQSTWSVLESDERLKDFGFRATHLMTVEAKEFVAAFYGEKQKYSYWNGCSTGGKQGLAEAQRFPADYDGIVEGDPASNFTHLMFGLQWYGLAARKVATPISGEKFNTLHKAVLKACDLVDGVEDGIIGNPDQCHFDPRAIACHDRDTPYCLTTSQLGVVAALYGGAKNPRTGKQIFPGQTVGSELGWTGLLHVPGPTLTSLSYFRYALHRDPAWTPQTLNFDMDVEQADRKNGDVLNDVDPDLSAFQAHRGKLIMFHGWSDPIISPGESIEYYRSVTEKLGATKASETVRLFMLPGVGHCQGGPGAFDFDKIAAIEQWTENGIAPDSLIATHKGSRDEKVITRPLCSYPKTAQWNGIGSSDDSANFVCR